MITVDPVLYEDMAARVRAAGTSFYWGMRLLETPRRYGMYGIYAFCREVDDIADEPGDPADKRRRLGWWREEIDRLYQGAPTHPVTRALQGPIREYELPQADFIAVIDGCEMDGDNAMVRPSLARLELYCDRVAAAVGRLSVRVFGESRPQGQRVANATGMALQLTNILRDVAVDAEIGRLYLPDELLSAHGIASRDPAEVLAHPALAAACRELAETARRHFAESDAAMATCSRRAMRPATLMKEMYRGVFRRLEAEGFQPRLPPVRMPTGAKLYCVLRYGLI
ncbi:MAG: hypothetical protein RLZZ501_30 [Pseudomonadota bacterium]|jgi:phytoene synthase